MVGIELVKNQKHLVLWWSKSSASFWLRGTEDQRGEVLHRNSFLNVVPEPEGASSQAPCTARLPHVLSCVSVPEGLARRLGHHSDRLERNATLSWTHMSFPRMPPGYSISLAGRTRACFRQGTDTGCGLGGAVGVLTGSCLPLWSTPSLCVPDLPGFWGWNSTGIEAYGAFCERPRSYRKTAWTNVT